MKLYNGEECRIQKWLLKKIAGNIVIQSQHHKRNITEFYSILVEAARKEFREDNKITLDDFLKECHQEALNKGE